MENKGKVSINILISQAYEKFWEKNKLSVDSDGKIFRTNVCRKRPMSGVDFRNPETIKKDRENEKVY